VNAAEAGKLLALMALYDNRKVGTADVVAWLKVIGDLRYADCEPVVVAYYAETRERIMPADVRQRVREARDERIREAGGVPAPPAELLDDPDAYRAALRAAATALADGRDPHEAMRAIARMAVRLELEAS